MANRTAGEPYHDIRFRRFRDRGVHGLRPRHAVAGKQEGGPNRLIEKRAVEGSPALKMPYIME